MSLDVYLRGVPTEVEETCYACGHTHKEVRSEELYWANITHNLGKMAHAAGIGDALWHPEDIGATKAGDIIPIVEEGLRKLKADPAHFKQFNASNGWGLYEHFVPWVESYLNACKEYPNATIEVSR